MERDTFEELMDRLDEVQDEAMDKSEYHRGANGEPTPKSMYFLGKDVGIAQVKSVLRERVKVEEE